MQDTRVPPLRPWQSMFSWSSLGAQEELSLLVPVNTNCNSTKYLGGNTYWCDDQMKPQMHNRFFGFMIVLKEHHIIRVKKKKKLLKTIKRLKIFSHCSLKTVPHNFSEWFDLKAGFWYHRKKKTFLLKTLLLLVNISHYTGLLFITVSIKVIMSYSAKAHTAAFLLSRGWFFQQSLPKLVCMMCWLYLNSPTLSTLHYSVVQ